MKRIISFLLSILIVTSCVFVFPNSIYAAEEENKDSYPYSIYASTVNILAKLTYDKEEIYNGRRANQKVEMLDKHHSILADYILDNCFSQNEPVYSDNSVYITKSLDYSVGSFDDITVVADDINADNIALYSRDENISIYCDDLSYNGLIYAPNGNVTIIGKDIDLNAVIIAKNVNIIGKTVTISKNDSIAEYLGNESDVYSEQKDNLTFNYDVFGRIVSIFANNTLLVKYVYEDSFTTNLIRIEYGNGTVTDCVDEPCTVENVDINNYVTSSEEVKTMDYTYEYDYNYDVISKIGQNGTDTSYEYENGMLVKTIDSLNNSTYSYKYDDRGNIIEKSETVKNPEGDVSDSQVNFVYDNIWQDRIINDGMYSYEYDEIGNPIMYKGWKLGWDNGRQLVSADNQDNNIVYAYNDNGIRISKFINGQEIKFVYADNKIVEQHDVNDLLFTYDENLELSGVIINGTQYSYIKNIEGDVEKIVDNSGNVVVSYAYDPYGAVVSIAGELADTIGVINPIRYRSYYYDSETQLYYLQTRYYDPQNGRFINPDDFCLVEEGKSLYVYCNNNPVRYTDADGMFAWDSTIPPINSAYDYEYFVNVWIPAHPEYYFSSYATKLGYYESSNNYKAVNSGGYLGYWQMGKIALQDVGYKDSNGNWTTKANNLGIKSNSDFLNNKTAQDKIFVEYCKKQWGYIKSYGLNNYVGKSYDGVKITDSGLLAACHLIGASDMRDVLVSGKVITDGNGTSPKTYMQNIAGYNVSYIK